MGNQYQGFLVVVPSKKDFLSKDYQTNFDIKESYSMLDIEVTCLVDLLDVPMTTIITVIIAAKDSIIIIAIKLQEFFITTAYR